MKTTILALLAILALPLMSFSQGFQKKSDSPKVGVYLGTFSEYVNPRASVVKNHLSTGLEFGLKINENYQIGIYHLFSQNPNDLWVARPEDVDNLKLVQYGLNLSYRKILNKTFYWQGGSRVALGDIRQMYKDEKDCECPGRLKSSGKFNSVLLSPDLRIGLQVFRWFSVETGLTYRLALTDREKWGVHSNDFEGLGTTFSLKATF